jgi:hypothetical protein
LPLTPPQIEALADRGLFLAPVGDGEQLCVVMTADENRWYVLREHGWSQYLGSNHAAMSVVRQLAPSPDGTWLAVLSTGEGHPFIEVVDLPRLIADGSYTVAYSISTHPNGVVWINRWEGDCLIVDSTGLLSRQGDGYQSSMGFELEHGAEYSLDVRSGTLAWASAYAPDPVRAFAQQLKARHFSWRLDAACALERLGDRSALPDLRDALRVETDPYARGAIEDAIKAIEK